MRGPRRSTNSLPGAGRLSADVAMRRPRPPRPIASRSASTKPPAAAAGITRKPSRTPSRSGSADANRKLDTDAKVLGAISKVENGSEPDVPALFGPALFYVSSHAVVGRFARLTVVPLLVLSTATPHPHYPDPDNAPPLRSL